MIGITLAARFIQKRGLMTQKGPHLCLYPLFNGRPNHAHQAHCNPVDSWLELDWNLCVIRMFHEETFFHFYPAIWPIS